MANDAGRGRGAAEISEVLTLTDLIPSINFSCVDAELESFASFFLACDFFFPGIFSH